MHLMLETDEKAVPRPLPANMHRLQSIVRGKGRLRQNRKGAVFLDVDNEFVRHFLPYFERFGLMKPPYFNVLGTPEGAHIPIVSAKEAALSSIGIVNEQEIPFWVTGLYSIVPDAWPEVTEAWYFMI
ncbi:MAG: hypothetical protein RL235_1042, partial [Chlamydiota bacterium]